MLAIRTRRTLLASAAILIVLTIGVAVQIPAYQAYRWLLGSASGVQASDFSGSVWNGRAGQFSVDGYQLGEIDWVLSPGALLLGQIQVDWTVSGREVQGQGRVQRALWDTAWTVQDLRAKGPATWLQVVVQEPFLQLEGFLDAEISQARIDREGWLLSANGQCHWRSAAVGGTLRTELGDLAVHFRTEEQAIVGDLIDAGGPLGLTGTVQVRDRQYTVDARLEARADVAALRQALLIMGSPDESGRTRLAISGPMLPLSGWM